ncbi:MAG: glycosyltransferase family 4 protein [Thermacetogeniaceae bacterium]
MRVLMLSWEFPPRSVGGLSQHVADLSAALARIGEDVHVVTCAAPGAPEAEVIGGVHVYRVDPYHLPALDFITWVLQLNLSMAERAVSLISSGCAFDLVHAHDWLVAFAGRVLKHAYRLPLIATIHATEYGRNGGLHNDLQRYISDVEWWLTYEAWRVIVCSRYMEDELKRIFQLPGDKIRVVPNGVDLRRYQRVEAKELSRGLFAAPGEKIVLYVGRLVHEKGAHLLIEAVPKILYRYPKAKFVIAGKGPAADYLKGKARQLGVEGRVCFTGYVDDATRDFLYRQADVAVFPSLYEPFGMVVLEAMAARAPVVVSDVGGLSEIVQHEHNGLKFYAGNSDSLADNVLRLLIDSDLAARLAERAYRELPKLYAWDEIARKTLLVYKEVRREYEAQFRRKNPWLLSKTSFSLEDSQDRYEKRYSRTTEAGGRYS